jgi:hypothetical protein
VFEDLIKLEGEDERKVKEKESKRENCAVANRGGKRVEPQERKEKANEGKTKRR